MTYTQLLNTALELLDEQGPQQAFDFMQQQSPNVEYRQSGAAVQFFLLSGCHVRPDR